MDLERKFMLLGTYVAHDMDDTSATTKYYGFLAVDGSWYIMKSVLAASITTYRFIRGRATAHQISGGDYATNWTNRAALSYGYINAIFV